MDLGNLLSLVIGFVLALLLKQWEQTRDYWNAGRQELQTARRENFAELTSAVSAFIHSCEVRTYEPGFQPPREGDPLTEQDAAQFDAIARVHAALTQIALVSRIQTIGAAQHWVNVVTDIIDAGHYNLPADHPLREERIEAHENFVQWARAELNVMPLGFDEYRLKWWEQKMLQVPGLRVIAYDRAMRAEPAQPSPSTDEP